jgi:lipopolysaccharide/colanic/teichoic acid biosynthesis glycosyltransferase
MAETAKKKSVLLPVVLDRKYARSDEDCDVESLEISDQAISESVRAHNSDGYHAAPRSVARHLLLDAVVFAGSDALSLLMASLLSSLLAGAFGSNFGFAPWMFAQIPMWWLFGITNRLYPGWGLSPLAELRKVTLTSSAVLLTTLLYAAFGGATALNVNLLTVALSFFLGTALIYALRTSIASRLSMSGRGGQATVIYGATTTGRKAARSIASDPRSGLHPVAFLDDDPGKWGQSIDGIPVLGDTNLVVPEATAAIVALPRTSTETLHGLLNGPLSYYHQITTIPEQHTIAAQRIHSLDGRSYFGLDVSKNPVHPDMRGSKRVLDITILLLFLPVILAATIILATSGFINSRSSPIKSSLYTTERKRTIVIYKIRLSMRMQQVLKHFDLEELAYLPTAVNLLNGSMSIVGSTTWQTQSPADTPFFARPGLISLVGASALFPALDSVDKSTRYYVRNWTIWLDLLIIGKSIGRLLRP